MAAGTWIYELTSSGGAGAGLPIGDVPPVHITPSDPTANPPYTNPRLYWRTNHRVEIDVDWTPDSTATADNFIGLEIYIEDPDVSSATNAPMDGTVQMNGTAQTSGQWSPVFVNKNAESPAVIFPDNTMGGMQGASYRMARSVRIYLLSYGPHAQAKLVRADQPDATPNVVIAIPLGEQQGQSGQEYTALVTNAHCSVTPDYDRPDPSYHLTFFYTPPDTSVAIPPGQNAFGGVRIHYLYPDAGGNYFDGSGNPINDADSGIDVPTNQSSAGYNSPVYTASAGGGSFRCYFCSEDDSFPTGMHINSLVQGVTPYCQVTIGAVSAAPDVSAFYIDGLKTSSGKPVWMVDGSVYLEAKFTWTLPAAASNSLPYAGVILYLVNVAGSVQPLTPFPTVLAGPLPNVDTGFILDINNIPPSPGETWTIAAISVDQNNKLSDNPANPTHSPTVTWTVAPPTTGNAPLVTVTPNQQFGVTQSQSTDGVGMVQFSLGDATHPAWANPTGNQFGGLEVAMVVNHDPTKPTYWQVPAGQTWFTTPQITSFGNDSVGVPVDFFLVSDDPQGHKNAIVYGTTPLIGSFSTGQQFVPKEGAVIPARSGWFDQNQFKWNTTDPNAKFVAGTFSAQNIQVGSKLLVGGGPASFLGNDNGQIAVMSASQQLIGWIGQQNAGNAGSPGLQGAWFKQLWIGGNDPLTAPVFTDSQGIIEVGGIAALQGSAYPYISIRDASGYEKGRIGAALNVPVAGSIYDGVGPNPPNITAGAWFTQLAIGGSNISNWNILIVPDSTALGTSVQMRNINLFQIDYAASGVVPKSNQYRLLMGSSVWNSGGGASQWQFPGMQIYEVDGHGGTSFGSTLLNRGLVLKGSYQQSYPVLASLVTFNGDSTGNDASNSGQFWAELTLYSPYSTPANQIMAIDMASGQQGSGDPYFRMYDHNANQLFIVDGSGNVTIKGVLQGVGAPSGSPPVAPGITATSYNVLNYPTPGANQPVIDSAGNWKGNPITGGSGTQIQSPWATDIQGATHHLLNAGEIHGSSFYIGGSSPGQGAVYIIDGNGNWLGGGVVKSVSGTAGQVNVSTSAGAATVSIPNPMILNPGGLCLNQANDGSGYQLQVYGGIEMTAADASHNILSKGTATNAIAASGGGITSLAGYYVSGYGQVINSAGNWVGPTIATAGVSSLTGTAQQITVSAATGAVTLSFPSWVQMNFLTINQGNDGSGYFLQVWGGIEMSGPVTNFNILCKSTVNNAIYANAGGITAHTGFWLEGTQVINASGNFCGPNCLVSGTVGGNVTTGASYVTCGPIGGGWAVAWWGGCPQGGTRVYFGDLIANNWNASTPIISYNGIFQGAAVNVGGNITSAGAFSCTGGAAGYQTQDRTVPSQAWTFYAHDGVAAIWWNGYGDLVRFTSTALYYYGNVNCVPQGSSTVTVALVAGNPLSSQYPQAGNGWLQAGHAWVSQGNWLIQLWGDSGVVDANTIFLYPNPGNAANTRSITLDGPNSRLIVGYWGSGNPPGSTNYTWTSGPSYAAGFNNISAAKLKRDIRPVEPEEVIAAFSGLQPVRHRFRQPVDSKLEYGFTVDDMAKVPALDSVIQQWGDDDGSYSVTQVLAITVARLKQLEIEIAELRKEKQNGKDVSTGTA